MSEQMELSYLFLKVVLNCLDEVGNTKTKPKLNPKTTGGQIIFMHD